MYSDLRVSAAQNTLGLLNPLENLCIEKKINTSFKELRKFLENPSQKIEKSRDIYPLYIEAYKTTMAITDLEIKRDFITILEALNGMYVPRVGTTPIFLDFDPIIDAANHSKDQIVCRLEIVDRQNLKMVQEAALALHMLSEEGIGASFGVNVYKAVLQSPDALCIVAKNTQDKIIGCALGTHVDINKQQHPPLKVFHIWLAARKANYPLIHLTTLLQSFEKDVTERFNPDYLSLAVEMNNTTAANLYNVAGFKEIARKASNTFSNSPTAIMLKNMREPPTENKPTPEEISSAVQAQGMQLLGYGWAVLYMTAFNVTRTIRKLWYK